MTSDSSSQQDHSSRHPAGGYGELLAVAVPMILSAGTQSLMHVVDRVFLAWDSQDSVAASLPAGILFWSLLSFPIGVASYLNAFVAQYEGAKKPDRVSASVWQGIYFAIGCGLLLILPGFWSNEIFQTVGHDEKIWPKEATFFRWLCVGSIFAVVPAALSCFFSGRGKTMIVLAVNASAVLVNAGLDWALIFGKGPFPAWGIAGAATATNLANVYATICYCILLYRYSAHEPYQFWKHRGIDWHLLRDLFHYGGPSGLQMFLDVAGFTAFLMIIGWIGRNELAATNIAFNLNSLAFTPVIGVGIAVSTLVGKRIGERRPEIAAASTWKGFYLGGGIMLVCGAIYILFPQVLLKPYYLYAEDQEFSETRNTVIVLLRFVALYSFFDAMAIVFGSAIRAAGDTVFSMVATFSFAWGLLVIPTYLTWKIYKPDLFVSWIWCSLYIIALGFVFLGRFLSGKWKSMSIIEEDSVSLDSDARPEVASSVI